MYMYAATRLVKGPLEPKLDPPARAASGGARHRALHLCGTAPRLGRGRLGRVRARRVSMACTFAFRFGAKPPSSPTPVPRPFALRVLESGGVDEAETAGEQWGGEEHLDRAHALLVLGGLRLRDESAER